MKIIFLKPTYTRVAASFVLTYSKEIPGIQVVLHLTDWGRRLKIHFCFFYFLDLFPNWPEALTIQGFVKIGVLLVNPENGGIRAQTLDYPGWKGYSSFMYRTGHIKEKTIWLKINQSKYNMFGYLTLFCTYVTHKQRWPELSKKLHKIS